MIVTTHEQARSETTTRRYSAKRLGNKSKSQSADNCHKPIKWQYQLPEHGTGGSQLLAPTGTATL